MTEKNIHIDNKPDPVYDKIKAGRPRGKLSGAIRREMSIDGRWLPRYKSRLEWARVIDGYLRHVRDNPIIKNHISHGGKMTRHYWPRMAIKEGFLLFAQIPHASYAGYKKKYPHETERLELEIFRHNLDHASVGNFEPAISTRVLKLAEKMEYENVGDIATKSLTTLTQEQIEEAESKIFGVKRETD